MSCGLIFIYLFVLLSDRPRVSLWGASQGVCISKHGFTPVGNSRALFPTILSSGRRVAFVLHFTYAHRYPFLIHVSPQIPFVLYDSTKPVCMSLNQTRLSRY